MVNKAISTNTIERLMVYANYLRSLSEPPQHISATSIAEQLGLNHVVVRKDLAEVSDGGRPKVGYETIRLLADIEHALGYDELRNAVIVGAGNLGRALMRYDGFKTYGMQIAMAFDIDETMAGCHFGNVPVRPVAELENLVIGMNIHIGIITVPAAAAQAICDRLISCGIRAIWNFAPVKLAVPPHVMVRSENMAVSLALLSQHLSGAKDSGDAAGDVPTDKA